MLSRIVTHYAIFFRDVSAEFVVGVPRTPIVIIPGYVWSNTQIVVLPLFLSKSSKIQFLHNSSQECVLVNLNNLES